MNKKQEIIEWIEVSYSIEKCVFCKEEIMYQNKLPVHYDNDSNPWCHKCWCKKW